MTETQTIDEAFRIFSLSLDDLRKILEAEYHGPGPNFLAGEVVMAVTEPIAKTYHPFVVGRGGVQNPATTLGEIDAKEAATHFFENCFSNTRYGQLAYLIWDCFRNGHVHLFQPKKIINVSLPQYNNSFLAGVHWSSTKPSEITNDSNQEQQERSEHLQFALTTIGRRSRPFFRFSPLFYYLDLVEAVQTFRNMIDSDNVLKQNFLGGYQLLVDAKRMDFNSRLRAAEQNLILSEIQNI
ncbi:MAG: hypothetical protein UT63_C0078G0004 [Candidatus Gottesmanbacteria bacterium GW2011_GWC2_39_8]|uniref:Uncharacterized protein n=1 Tax=Candidatus Gottesmanbacteria bacterium GW2011_GWC2_39_8 TaxID=1618450 RepID=A0A0G0PST4_9BACT|nr:MAG: hypothetical protein UT63_C0078G0004 [Candidatus Gottesmanbacteria bacterium GW2011_GWC2_39_8]